jgi:pyruvate/2-oxoglutarate dehydrogenase complex dihydrolipoamide acyltransferase (E2) component
MPISVLAPDLGDGVTHAMIGCWYANVGQLVEKDEPLVDVVTDKAAFEVTSPATGVLTEICFAVDEEFETGSILARIGPA